MCLFDRPTDHSTETALLKVVNDLLGSINNGDMPVLALLDQSAAFDTLDHSILVNRLNACFGISGSVLSWFTSYDSSSNDLPLDCTFV